MANEKERKQIEEEIRKAYDFINELQSIGGRVPKLVQQLEVLQEAVATGRDIGLAAKDTQRALQYYTDDLKRVCEMAPDDDRYVCEAQIDRKWQAHAINWTFSFKNRESVVNNSIRRIICRHLPEIVGKRIQMCVGVLVEGSGTENMKAPSVVTP